MSPLAVVRNWAALLVILLALGAAVWLANRYVSADAGTLLTLSSGAAIAVLGLLDGILRALGRPAVLGESHGASRWLALVQILLSASLLILVLR